MMELQYSSRASPSTMEEEDVLEREREAPKAKVRSPPSPPLYIGGLRGGGPRRSNLLGGCGQGEESLLPKAPRRCLPLLGLFLLETLGAWASWGWCPWTM